MVMIRRLQRYQKVIFSQNFFSILFEYENVKRSEWDWIKNCYARRPTSSLPDSGHSNGAKVRNENRLGTELPSTLSCFCSKFQCSRSPSLITAVLGIRACSVESSN